MALASTKPIT